MGSDAPDPLGYHRRAGVIEVPGVVADEEPLHRRIHPTFVRPDGSVSSQAFRDREMSVDRGLYWEPARGNRPEAFRGMMATDSRASS